MIFATRFSKHLVITVTFYLHVQDMPPSYQQDPRCPLNNVHALQEALVCIWQRYITMFHEKEDYAVAQTVASQRATGTAAAEYVANGHQIAPRDGNPGVFCRKMWTLCCSP